jgi:hypothetical protein
MNMKNAIDMDMDIPVLTETPSQRLRCPILDIGKMFM